MGDPDGSRADPPRAGARIQTLRIASAAVLVISLFALARALPIETIRDSLTTLIDGLGPWGPLAFGVLYALLAALMFPGAALTLVAGPLFGLALGFVVVSLASTAGAGLAFLIGRHLARDAVAARAALDPRFAAVDRAIGEEGGWKIVGLLRLTPLMPYNLANYLFGLTAIRFWPYLVTSWIAMMPGTLLYVYVGKVAAEGVAAATGDGGQSARDWVIWGVGLVVTVALTVYVTRLARRAIRNRPELAQVDQVSESLPPGSGSSGRPWGAVALAMAALLVAAATVWAYLDQGRVQSWFGPPTVDLRESYRRDASAPPFDHGKWDALLRRRVDGRGRVDYAALAADPGELDAYIAALEAAPFVELDRDGKLALLLNSYNAFTIRLILDHWPVGRILDVPADERWRARRWNVGGQIWSLEEIEHQQVRPHFEDPRIHFALVCAALGCPPLRAEAYDPGRLEQQLQDQALRVHRDPDWFSYDRQGGIVHLTELYRWYAGDFRQVGGSVLGFAAGFVPELAADLKRGREPEVEWIDYDWALNVQPGNGR